MEFITLDGGYGTNLQKYNDKIELLNIENPDVVYDLQKKYVTAGSEILLTNTFGISRFENYNEIAKKGVEIAKKAIENTETKIAFSIGPDFSNENRDFYSKIDIIDDIDFVFIETMTSFDEIKKAVNAFKKWKKPIFISISPSLEMKMYDKTELSDVAKYAEENGISAIGINCGYGFNHVYGCLKELKKHTKLPLIAKPNFNLNNTDREEDCGKLQAKIEKIIQLDVKYFGFCCGSNADDIKLLSSHKK